MQKSLLETLTDRCDSVSPDRAGTSKILRSGLVPGTRTPAFSSADILSGRTVSFDDFLGSTFLIVLSDQNCAPCNALIPQLEALHRRTPDVQVIMITRGEPDAMREKSARWGVSFPVLMQRRWEVSMKFGLFMTPAGFLIDGSGLIASKAAIGAVDILALKRAAAIQNLLSDG
jgi:peroxiredoxin